jgi:hypothetical protein
MLTHNEVDILALARAYLTTYEHHLNVKKIIELLLDADEGEDAECTILAAQLTAAYKVRP